MPNHIINNVRITGNDLGKFTKKYQEVFESGEFFNTIIPMPVALNSSRRDCPREDLPNLCEDPSHEDDHSYLLDGEPPKSKSHWDIWMGYRRECEQVHGAKDWYDWRCAHWGTKWDAYDSCGEWGVTSVDLVFSTAWSHSLPIIQALAKEFPSLNFNVVYCDEGNRENTGWYEVCLDNGIDESESHPDIFCSAEVYAEVMSRTYGEDWWDCYDEADEEGIYDVSNEDSNDDVHMDIPSDEDIEQLLFDDEEE